MLVYHRLSSFIRRNATESIVFHADTLHVHGVTSVGKVEAARLAGAVGAEAKLAVGAGRLSHALIGILLLIREVLLDNVVGLHVNLLVGVVLTVVNLLHATALLDEEGVLVKTLGTFTSSLLVQVTNLENILKTVKGNLDDFIIRADEEVTEGLDAALSDEVSDLLRLLQSSGRSVTDSPAGLLTGLEITVLEKMNQRRNDVGINDGLDLRRVPSGDVGNGPAGLLANTILGRAEEGKQAGKCTTVNDDLGLHVITSNNVADGAESRSLDRGGSVQQKLHKSARNAGLDDGLNLLIRSIRKVRDGPASIDEDLVVE